MSCTRRFTTSDTGHALHGIAYGNDTFVAVGGDDIVLTSSDGRNWTQQNLANFRRFEDIAFGNGVFAGLNWKFKYGSGNRNSASSPHSVDGASQARFEKKCLFLDKVL